jgi:tRNA pseudouridine38-40 synthase
MYLGKQRPALERHYVWHLPTMPDVNGMERAARCLVGSHDLAAFTAPSEAKRSVTLRQVTKATLTRDGLHLRFDIEANAFLKHMVRRIVGTLGEVGSGRKTVAEFEQLVKEAPPGQASRTAPPGGLCLMKVRYESGIFDETDEDI